MRFKASAIVFSHLGLLARAASRKHALKSLRASMASGSISPVILSDMLIHTASEPRMPTADVNVVQNKSKSALVVGSQPTNNTSDTVVDNGGPSVRPSEPEPDDCCGNDCRDCVWIDYSLQLALWQKKGR